MEFANATLERPMVGPKKLNGPTALKLGQYSKILLVPRSDTSSGILALSQDRPISKWQANQKANDFSIGRSGADITLDDSMLSEKHLRVYRDGNNTYHMENLGSSNGTLEQEIREVNGEMSVANNGWAFASLTEHPTVQIGSNLVIMQSVGDKMYISLGKRRVTVEEGVPFTIGASGDNNLVINDTTGNPFDRTTLVLFDGKVLVNSYARPVTIRTGVDSTPSSTKFTRSEATQAIADLEQKASLKDAEIVQLKKEKQVDTQRVIDLRKELENIKQTKDNLERTTSETIKRLQQENDRLKRADGRSTGRPSGIEEILRGLSSEEQRAILHDIRKAFGKQLHPDQNPRGNQEALKRANVLIDQLLSNAKK